MPKPQNRSHVYVSIPVGNLMDVEWVLSTLLNHYPGTMSQMNKDAKAAGFDTDMVTNAFNTVYFATHPGEDAAEVRAQLVEEYVEARTAEVLADMGATLDDERVASEARGLVREIAARLSVQEMTDHLKDIGG